MKTIRALRAFFFIFIFLFSPVSFSGSIVQSQNIDVEEIIGYQEWNQSRIIDKNVIVGPGATLVIGKGVEINFTNPLIEIQVEGNLFIKGTVKEPTFIKTDLTQGGFSIIAQPGSHMTIRNAEIFQGGSIAYIIGSIINRVSASSYKGAIQINGGNTDIQNTTFRNNAYAIIVDSSDAIVRVNRSRFIDNNFDVEAVRNASDFQYNWWGNIDGPQQNCSTYGDHQQQCYYEKIYGSLNFSNWLTQEMFRDPVLIVPGILGSEEGLDNQWVIDPILHTFDDLIDRIPRSSVPE